MVEPINIGENLYAVGENVRIERGPLLKTAIATLDLLDDSVTAEHYQAPKTVTVQGVEVETYSRDALGNPIKLGEEISYLDWLGDHVWYIYRLEKKPLSDEKGFPIMREGVPVLFDYWRKEDGHFDSLEAALETLE